MVTSSGSQGGFYLCLCQKTLQMSVLKERKKGSSHINQSTQTNATALSLLCLCLSFRAGSQSQHCTTTMADRLLRDKKSARTDKDNCHGKAGLKSCFSVSFCMQIAPTLYHLDSCLCSRPPPQAPSQPRAQKATQEVAIWACAPPRRRCSLWTQALHSVWVCRRINVHSAQSHLSSIL